MPYRCSRDCPLDQENKRNRENKLAAKRSDKRKKNIVVRKIKCAKSIGRRLCGFDGVECSEDNIVTCKMKHVAKKFKADELRSFITTRHDISISRLPAPRNFIICGLPFKMPLVEQSDDPTWD